MIYDEGKKKERKKYQYKLKTLKKKSKKFSIHPIHWFHASNLRWYIHKVAQDGRLK